MSVQVGSAFGKIEIDFSGVKRGVDAAVRQLSSFENATRRIGTQLKSAGDGMTAAITLPLVAAGVAASKMGMDFEASMQQIVGLVGVSQRQVDAWSKDLIAMGPELGRAPKELSQALYQVTSSGIESGKALEVVRQSAKAAAAGLGDTQVVADAVTSAMNAYRTSNLEASQATDILVATVREGKGEADAIAPALGRVIQVAAELGISFDQVGAAMAGMTLVGFDAAESATNLTGIMTAFLKPSKQASDIMAQFGLSGEQLREMAGRPGGLLDVLTLLRDTIGQDDEALSKIFPNVRGFRGMLALVGDNAEQVSGIFGRLAKSTGDADRAFQAATQTAKFQFNQAMAGVQSSLIALGNAILPVVIPILKQLAETLRRVTEWFSTLDRNTQQTIVQIGLIAVAIGPVLSIGGRLIATLGTVVGLLTSLGSTLGTAAKLAGSFAKTGFEVVQYLWEAGAAGAAAAASIGLLVAGLIVVIKFLDAASRAAKATNDELIKMANSDTGNVLEDTFNRAGASFEIVVNGNKRLRDTLDATHRKIQDGARDYKDYRSSIEATAKAAGYEIDEAGDLIQVTRGMGGEIRRVIQARYALNQAQFDGVRVSRREADETARLAGWMSTAGKQAQETAAATDEYAGALQGAIDEANAMAEAQRRQAEESAAAETQLKQLQALIDGPVGKAYEDYKTKQDELTAKYQALRDEQQKLIDSHGDHRQRLGEIRGALSDVSQSLSENAQAWDDHLKRVLFDIATEQLSMDGLTSTEVDALTTIAEKWGLIDKATADATRAVLGATSQLAADGNAEAFADNMTRALQRTKESAAETRNGVVNEIGPIGEAYAQAALAVQQKTGETVTATQTMATGVSTQVEAAKSSFGSMSSAFFTTASEVGIHTAAVGTATQTMMATVTGEGVKAAGALQPVRDEFSSTASSVRNDVAAVIDAINKMIKKVTGLNIKIPTPGGTGSGSGTPAPKVRAAGGPIFPGVSYLVNESGATRPEVIVPSAPGYVLTRQDAMAALRGSALPGTGIMGNQNIYVTIPVGQVSSDVDVELLAYRVADHIRRRR